MNEQQPYEKHLADKLRQLTQPGDANKHWPQMKSLLDRELPEGSGRKRRPGGWWMFGILAGILLTGGWFGLTIFSNDKKIQPKTATSPATVNTPEETTASPVESLPEGENNNASNPSTENNRQTKNATASINPNTPFTSSLPGEEKNNVEKKRNIIVSDKTNSNNPSPSATPNSDKKNKTNGVFVAAMTEKGSRKKAGINSSPGKKENASGEKINSHQETGLVTGKESGNTTIHQVTYNPSSAGSKAKYGMKGKGTENYLPGISAEKDAASTQVNQAIRNPGIGIIGPVVIFGDTLESDYAAELEAVRYTPKSRSRFKTESDRVKGLNNRTVGTGDNKNFVFGLSLPMGVPLGDQKVVAYNITGGSNTALDYLPMPHMQYHINQKSYVQAEVQFMSPQYIQPALLFKTNYEVPGNPNNIRYVSNSVYASKLYYFSLPIGIHYSPFKNFYVGSGMQFSSLLSGIAMSEKVGYYSSGPTFRDSLLSQDYSKFKNDSISGSLNGNEFRLMLDANYYWERFMVGLRYNQALSNYVNVRASVTSPMFTDKNKSIQFYLRYNLWEDNKRKKPGLAARK